MWSRFKHKAVERGGGGGGGGSPSSIFPKSSAPDPLPIGTLGKALN